MSAPFAKPRRFGRAPTRSVGVAVLALASLVAFAVSAEADDLPAQLLAAAHSIPADATGRRVCLSINGLTNAFRSQFVVGDQRVSAGSEAYSASTAGAYLGDGPAGAPASPFAQALLDVGAATRLRVIWTQHLRVPALSVPQLTDTGTVQPAVPAAPRQAFIDKQTVSEGDVYLVTGADRDLFSHDLDYIVPRPPPIADPAGTDPALQGPGTGTPPPPGIWTTSHVCYVLVPERVLEYGDVADHGNGISEVTALILFRPERMPAWVTDQRVIQTLQPPMKPMEVRGIVFRNDGDGWKAQPSAWPRLPGKTHILAEQAR